MSKPPSDATLLRTARSDMRQLSSDLARAQNEANNWRIRATKAEQEAAEWRKRFDALLLRVPTVKPLGATGDTNGKG